MIITAVDTMNTKLKAAQKTNVEAYIIIMTSLTIMKIIRCQNVNIFLTCSGLRRGMFYLKP
jgi:hypothetical protein